MTDRLKSTQSRHDNAELKLVQYRRYLALGILIGLISSCGWWMSALKSSDSTQLLSVAEAQSGPKWKEIAAGIIPTEFGELLSVNGTAGNYSLVFRDSDKVLRIVDLRGGKIPNRSLVIQRK